MVTIEAGTKWLPLSRRYFQMQFHSWKCSKFNYYFTEFCSLGSSLLWPNIGSDNGLAPTSPWAISEPTTVTSPVINHDHVWYVSIVSLPSSIMSEQPDEAEPSQDPPTDPHSQDPKRVMALEQRRLWLHHQIQLYRVAVAAGQTGTCFLSVISGHVTTVFSVREDIIYNVFFHWRRLYTHDLIQ